MLEERRGQAAPTGTNHILSKGVRVLLKRMYIPITIYSGEEADSRSRIRSGKPGF